MKIALDVMGGDEGVSAIIEGGLQATQELDVEIAFVGQKDKIVRELARHSFSTDRIEIVHASQVVEMHEEPGAAVRAKRDASVVVGTQLVKAGEVVGFVSAGNSGATLAAAQLFLGRLPGVRRSALGTVYPTLHGYCFVLDVGATADCKPEYLSQFGIMGSAYARGVLNIADPRIGLLSTGEEEGKGSLLVKEAHQLLKSGPTNFAGNVEGKDIPHRPVDVVVTDGFTGNTFLKTTEGVVTLLLKTLEREMKRRPHAMLGAALAKQAFAATRAYLDYTDYGGAALLGVNGIVIIAHGRSDSKAIKNAVRVAKQAAESDITGIIQEGVH